MNEKQLKIIKISAVIIGLMLLYPPYRIYGYGASSQAIVESGYSFIFSLPNRAVIDTLSLGIQWIGVGLVSFALHFISKGE
jgi:hypothetical protein